MRWHTRLSFFILILIKNSYISLPYQIKVLFLQ